ncbi:MAG: MtrAB system histidine kinase MtrB [Nocardioides sp.]
MATPSTPFTLHRALTFWRRSIQARVVISTLVLSAVVISGVGWLLLQQTQRGLLQHRVDNAVAEVNTAMAGAVRQVQDNSGSIQPIVDEREDVAGELISRGGSRGFIVLSAQPVGSTATYPEGATYPKVLDPASVPASLREHFSEVADTAWTYTRIQEVGHAPEPGVVVGSQVKLSDGAWYTMYFLFPLQEQQETLALVTRALVTAALLLLALIAGVAFLVTRQVVTPVRMARRVAERLAAGELQERVRVTGEDDLARLATSFNQMASNLQRQIRQLEELSRVQQQFVSDVSHELRTPLTTVRMASDVLHDARRSFDPTASRAAELLQKELDRFETLLVDLLEISRFDAGAAVLDLDEIDLVDVARRVVDQTQVLARQRHTHVVVQAPDRPCLAEADVRRVERIVRNLVTNAIDHARADDQGDSGVSRDVVVMVDADEHAASIAVRDYGVGLRPGESAMVFNRFWRADPARARTSGGTGLGLSISLEDTHLHGGWLQAWGRPGEGAQFRLTLPRHAGEALRQSPLPLVPVDAREVVA